MEMQVECSGCKKQMTITSTYSHIALAEVVIEVAPCTCSQPDCNECEDIIAHQEQAAKQRAELHKLRLQLKGAKMEFKEQWVIQIS